MPKILCRHAISCCTLLHIDGTIHTGSYSSIESVSRPTRVHFRLGQSGSRGERIFCGHRRGSSTARADRGAQFPLCPETAAEIARTINPNGYLRSSINRPSPPPCENFCSFSLSSSSCFATDERARTTDEHAAAIAVADAAKDRRTGRITVTRASAAHLHPLPVSLSPTSRTSIDLGFPVLPVHRVRRCSSELAIYYLVPRQCLARRRYFGLALESVDITQSQ